MSDKSYCRIIRTVFVLNCAFLVWAILWKCGVPFIGDGTERAISFTPFRGNTSWEMQFNILLFVPFGFLLSALKKRWLPRQIFAVISTSVFLEVAQYVLAVGRSDSTDILLNTLGGVIGIGIYFLLAKFFGKHSCAAVATSCVLIAAFEVYVSVSFILFGAVHLGFMMFKI